MMKHIPKIQNQEANRLAQSASGYQQIIEILADEVVVDKDWRKDIIEYLNNSAQQVSKKLWYFLMISYIIEQLMVCSLSVSTEKKLRF